MNRFVRLRAPDDAARLQQFLARCSDYYELHEGCATPADAGEYELSSVPPNATRELQVIGWEDDGGALQGVVQLLPDWPERGTWWIALLLLAPEMRGCGLGARMLQHAFELARADGATTMQLIVSIHNPRGQRFWEAAGFREFSKPQQITARSGHVDTGRFMTLAL